MHEHERRKLNRKYLAVYSRVFDRVSSRVLGYLADLSQKGTMIISGEPMPEKEILNLRFDLPDPTLFPIDHLDLQASVAWSSPDIDPAFYNVGFQFLRKTRDLRSEWIRHRDLAWRGWHGAIRRKASLEEFRSDLAGQYGSFRLYYRSDERGMARNFREIRTGRT